MRDSLHTNVYHHSYTTNHYSSSTRVSPTMAPHCTDTYCLNHYNVSQRETNTMEYRYSLLCVILALQIQFSKVKLHK